MILCILITSTLLYSCICTVILRCALRGTLLRCPVRPRVISRVYSPWFSFTYCYHDDVFLGRVGTHVLTLLPYWCWIRDLSGHCYMVLFPRDDDLMLPWCLLLPMTIFFITADYGLHLPLFSGWCSDDSAEFWTMYDIAVMSSSMSLMMSSFAIPPGGVPVVVVMICRVCPPVQLCCWWTSTTLMMGLSSPAPIALWAR